MLKRLKPQHRQFRNGGVSCKPAAPSCRANSVELRGTPWNSVELRATLWKLRGKSMELRGTPWDLRALHSNSVELRGLRATPCAQATP